MIENFYVLNNTTKDRITFGRSPEFDYVYKSIDWGSAGAEHSTYEYPDQIGAYIYSTKIKSRDVYITGWVFYQLTEDELKEIKNKQERRNLAYEKIKEKKKVLNDIFNPNDILKIGLQGYYLEGKPSSSIKYSIEEDDNNTYFCKFTVSIFCANPMFKKESKVLKALSGDFGMFHFTWILPPYGIAMGSRIDYLVLNVENEGNVEIGGKITITAKDIIVNPKLINTLTGEYIRINKTLEKGETIIINTEDGKERGIVGKINGIEYKYLKYWDFNNTWLKFSKGITMIEYSCENQNESMMDITVEINPQKYGMEEM